MRVGAKGEEGRASGNDSWPDSREAVQLPPTREVRTIAEASWAKIYGMNKAISPVPSGT